MTMMPDQLVDLTPPELDGAIEHAARQQRLAEAAAVLGAVRG